MAQDSLVKHRSKLPYWKITCSALFATFAIACLYHSIFTPPKPGGPNNPGNIAIWVFFAFVCAAFAWQLSLVTHYIIDLENKRYFPTQKLKMLPSKGWKYFNTIDQLSLAKKSRRRYYVQIQYRRKSRWMILSFNDYKSALSFAKDAALKLEVNLNDKTMEA